MEIVVKATKAVNSFKEQLLENHFMKLISDEDTICRVFEEIIIYDKKK